MKNSIFFQLLVCLIIDTSAGYSQNVEWLLGEWHGSSHVPGSIGYDDFALTLNIQSTTDGIFEGTTNQSLLNDPLTRIESSVTGRVYKEHFTCKSKEILYVKEPSYGSWVKNCNQCDSILFSLSIQQDSMILKAVSNCSLYLCASTTYYSKALHSLDSVSLKSLERYVDNSKITSLISTLKNYIKSIYNPSVASNNIVTSNQAKLDSIELLSIYKNRIINVLRYVETDEDSVDLKLFDNGTIDNDTITVLYNGEVIIEKLRLTDTAYKIKIPVYKFRQNQLIVFAENLGTIPPNTGLAELIYGQKTEEIFVTSDYNKNSGIIISSSRGINK